MSLLNLFGLTSGCGECERRMREAVEKDMEKLANGIMRKEMMRYIERLEYEFKVKNTKVELNDIT